MAGLWDRQGTRWVVFDSDGTREAARVSRPAPDSRSTCPLAPLTPSVCSWLHGAQTRGSCPNPHHSPPCAHAPVARHIRQSWEREVTRRVAPRSGSSPDICEDTRFCRRTRSSPNVRTIWYWSSPGRPGRPGICHARQRLLTVGSSRGSGPLAPARLPST